MKKLLISIALIPALLVPSALVFAQVQHNPLNTSEPTGSASGTATPGILAPRSTAAPTWDNYVPDEAKRVSGLDKAAKNIIRILLILASVVAIIYLIIGGYTYVTAGGNADAAGAAKNTVLNALIGLIIIFSAYAIVYWILDKFLNFS